MTANTTFPALERVVAERDRLAFALRTIATIHSTDGATVQDCIRVAREALSGTETRSSHTAEVDSPGVASVPPESSHDVLHCAGCGADIRPGDRMCDPCVSSALHRERLEDENVRLRSLLLSAAPHVDQQAYPGLVDAICAALDPKAENLTEGHHRERLEDILGRVVAAWKSSSYSLMVEAMEKAEAALDPKAES